MTDNSMYSILIRQIRSSRLYLSSKKTKRPWLAGWIFWSPEWPGLGGIFAIGMHHLLGVINIVMSNLFDGVNSVCGIFWVVLAILNKQVRSKVFQPRPT